MRRRASQDAIMPLILEHVAFQGEECDLKSGRPAAIFQFKGKVNLVAIELSVKIPMFLLPDPQTCPDGEANRSGLWRDEESNLRPGN